MVQSKPLHLGETLLVAFAGGFLFDLARFPAGWMAGAMVAVAIAALAGRPMFMPTLLARVFFIALGITVGGIATPDTVRGMMTWPLNIALIAVAMLVTTLAASVYLTRVHGWSAQTAMFAAVPGALSQVVVMAADRDADLRGIVVVQTVRAIATTIGVPIALILFGLAGPAQFPVSGPGLIEAPWQAALLVVAAIAAALALYRVGFSGGFFFGPMVVSAFLHGSGLYRAAAAGLVRQHGDGRARRGQRLTFCRNLVPHADALSRGVARLARGRGRGAAGVRRARRVCDLGAPLGPRRVLRAGRGRRHDDIWRSRCTPIRCLSAPATWRALLLSRSRCRSARI